MAEHDKKREKEGVTVRELEGFARKHRLEIFYLLLFIFASLFTMVFWGAEMSILLAGVGTILGIFLPEKVASFSNKFHSFISKQERMTQIILGIVGLVIGIFIPPLVFLFLGLHGGKSLINRARESFHSDR